MPEVEDATLDTTQEPQQAPAPVVQHIDPAILAAQITNSVVASIRQDMRPQEKGPLQQTVEEMIAEGYNPVAIKQILKLQIAKDFEAQQAQRSASAKNAETQYANDCVRMAREELAEFEEAMPFVKGCPDLIIGRASQIWLDDKKFAHEHANARNLNPPPRKSVRECLAKAAEEYAKEWGFERKNAPPVDAKTSKPEIQKSKDVNLKDLHPNAQKLYHQIMSATNGDHEMAMTSALRMSKAS